MSRARFFGAGLLLCAVVIVATRPREAAPVREPTAPEATRAAADPPPPSPGAPDAPLAGLRGTAPSGGLTVDAEGHFVPGPEALLFFQYYLSASNEAPIDVLAGHIQAAIAERLDPPADAEARAFLARYLDYLAAGDQEFRAPGLADPAALERRLQWVRELRREHFGPALAEHLFGERERALEVHLERRRIARDPGFDPEADRERLEALEAAYPESVREARARASLPLRHAAEERALRESGASEAEVDALRERRFGPEAAARMRALDAERAAFAERLAAYRRERDATLADLEDPGARAEALATLRAAHFDESEVHRIRILDRQEATTAPD